MHGLTPGEQYIFRVKAVNAVGTSENSQESDVIKVQAPLCECGAASRGTRGAAGTNAVMPCGVSSEATGVEMPGEREKWRGADEMQIQDRRCYWRSHPLPRSGTHVKTVAVGPASLFSKQILQENVAGFSSYS